MIKSLENKHVNPGPLGPFLTTDWEKNHLIKLFNINRFNNYNHA